MSAPQDGEQAPELTQEQIEDVLSAALIRLYRSQNEDGRAAILGFFHLADTAAGRLAALRISRAGDFSLGVRMTSEEPETV